MSGEEFDLGIAGLEVATRIGEGGNALVYRARQPELDRSVAVKVLKHADDDTRRRFDRERRAMGRLSQHDGIVTVYETGYTPSGQPFLVMPLLERALDDEIRDRGPLPWRESVGLMADVCLTVAHAHDEGVVHRDLKPGNLMLARSGRVMVSDFGISRITNTSTSLMSTALTLTPAFSPPEALEVGDALVQSDVYSLGATLYALLAGHPPFMPPDEDVSMLVLIRRIVEQPVEPLPAPVPDAVNEVLRTALAKSPGDRYRSAREMAAALTAATDPPPAAPPPRRAPPQATPPSSTHPSSVASAQPPSPSQPPPTVAAPGQPVNAGPTQATPAPGAGGGTDTVRLGAAVLLGWAVVAMVRVASAYSWGGWDVDLGVRGGANVWDLFSSTIFTSGGPVDDVDFLYRPHIASPLLWLTVAVGFLAGLTLLKPARFRTLTGVLALVHAGLGVVLNLGNDFISFPPLLMLLQAVVPCACAWLLLRARPGALAPAGSPPTAL